MAGAGNAGSGTGSHGREIAGHLASTIKAPRDGVLFLLDIADAPLLPGGDGRPRRDPSRECGPHTAAYKPR